jgi:biotin carboxyl carrier protein
MATAKAISLTVRPTQSSDLCYPVSGIIEYQPENLLGMTVSAYDLITLKDQLRPSVELPSPTSLGIQTGNFNPPSGLGPGGIDVVTLPRPIGDGPDEIESGLGRAVLSRLRSQDIATSLKQALAWYGLKNSADFTNEAVRRRTELLGKTPSDPNSLPGLLSSLSKVLKKRHELLAYLYEENEVEAVTTPTSISTSSSHTTGGQSFQTSSNTETTHKGHEFQTPPADNTARYLRAEIALRQERLAAYRLVKMNSSENVDYAKAMTAADIRKIQLDYIDTFLVAPFDGVVTAVFRNLGEFVSAGQAVLRVENDRTVYLVGQIKCRSLIRVGYTAQVTTTLFGEPGGAPVQIDGTVCAVRGHEPVDEQWNVIIRCDNQGPGGRILPLNYNFDFDSTDIVIEA